MRKFNVGDRVRIDCPADPWGMHGREATIVDLPGCWPEFPGDYQLDLYHEDDPMFSDAKWLVPVYDGDEPAKWADCVWQPTQLTA